MPTFKSISKLLRRKKSRKVDLKRQRSKSHGDKEWTALKQGRESAKSISLTQNQHGQLSKEYRQAKERRGMFASQHGTIDESRSHSNSRHEDIETTLMREHVARTSQVLRPRRSSYVAEEMPVFDNPSPLPVPQSMRTPRPKRVRPQVERKRRPSSTTAHPPKAVLQSSSRVFLPRAPVNSVCDIFNDLASDHENENGNETQVIAFENNALVFDDAPSPSMASVGPAASMISPASISLIDSSPLKLNVNVLDAKTPVQPAKTVSPKGEMVFNHVPSPSRAESMSMRRVSKKTPVMNHSIFILDGKDDSIITRSGEDIEQRRAMSPSVMLVDSDGSDGPSSDVFVFENPHSPTRANIDCHGNVIEPSFANRSADPVPFMDDDATDATIMELVRPDGWVSTSHRSKQGRVIEIELSERRDRGPRDHVPSPSRVSVSRVSVSHLNIMGHGHGQGMPDEHDGITPISINAPSNDFELIVNEEAQMIIKPDVINPTATHSFAPSATMGAIDFSIGPEFQRQVSSANLWGSTGSIERRAIFGSGSMETGQIGENDDEITDFVENTLKEIPASVCAPVKLDMDVCVHTTTFEDVSSRRMTLDTSGYLNEWHCMSTHKDKERQIRQSYLPRLNYLEGVVNKLVDTNGALMNGFQTFIDQYSLEKEMEMDMDRHRHTRQTRTSRASIRKKGRRHGWAGRRIGNHQSHLAPPTTRSLDESIDSLESTVSVSSTCSTSGASHSEERAMKRKQFDDLMRLKRQLQRKSHVALEMQREMDMRREEKEYRKTLEFKALAMPNMS